MKIVKGFPPNISTILEHLKVKNIEAHKPIFCYGDTIYNPYEVEVTPDQEKHEECHSQQQAFFPDIWWMTYLLDKKFRLEQEIEAYGTQLAFLRTVIDSNREGKKLLKWFEEKMAQALSGDLYDVEISYGAAESKIRNFAKSHPCDTIK